MKIKFNTDKLKIKKYFKNAIKKADIIYIISEHIDRYTSLKIKKYLKSNPEGKLRIIINVNNARTSPKALKILLKLERKYDLKVALFRSSTDSLNSNCIAFKKGGEYRGVFGNFNLSKESLNSELSSYIYRKDDKKCYKSIIKAYKQLIEHEDIYHLNMLTIKKYEFIYDKLRGFYSSIDAANKAPDHWIFDRKSMSTLFDNWKTTEESNMLLDSLNESYNQAYEVLSEISSNDSLDPAELESHLDILIGTTGVKGVWDSQGMQSHKHSIVQQSELFQEMVKESFALKDQYVEDAYDILKAYSERITGVGYAIINEILFTVNRDRFFKIKQELLKLLATQAGIRIPVTPQNFSGEDYYIYNRLLWDLKERMHIEQSLDFDQFIDYLFSKEGSAALQKTLKDK